MTTGLAAAAAAAMWMASGQLAQPAEPPSSPAEAATEVPAPPPVPAPRQRIEMTDGTERFGRVVGAVEGGVEIESDLGARYALPLTLISRIEPVDAPASGPRKVELEPSPERMLRELTLSFDVRELEERKRELSYGDKAALLVLGAATTAFAFVFEGDRRAVVAGVGIVEAVTGGVWLGATAYRGWQIDQELARKRAELGGAGR